MLCKLWYNSGEAKYNESTGAWVATRIVNMNSKSVEVCIVYVLKHTVNYGDIWKEREEDSLIL